MQLLTPIHPLNYSSLTLGRLIAAIPEPLMAYAQTPSITQHGFQVFFRIHGLIYKQK
jgi:hypothetical protein